MKILVICILLVVSAGISFAEEATTDLGGYLSKSQIAGVSSSFFLRFAPLSYLLYLPNSITDFVPSRFMILIPIQSSPRLTWICKT